MSEYAELKLLIEQTNKKVDRVLSWAEGDDKLGTPSIKQQINNNTDEITKTRKIAYENRENINLNVNELKNTSEELKNMKKASGAYGVGGGGIITIIIEAIRSAFT